MKFLIPLFCASMFLLLVVVGCDKQAADGEGAGGGMPPAQVAVMTVGQRDVPVSFEFTGQVAGSNEAEIHARVTGIIEKRLYEEGSTVKAGQPLFQLDDAMFRAEVAQAEAALASAQAQLKKAERDFARIAPLSGKKLVSQSERDDTASAVDIAKASVMQAKASLDRARISLDYTTIESPLDGIAGRALKREGSLVQAGGDSLLTTVAQTDPAYVDFGMAASEFNTMRDAIAQGGLLLPETGFAVGLKTADGKLLGQTGAMNFQDYKVDEHTGNVAMRASIGNSQRTLLPGQFVRVLLQGGIRPDAVVVPQRAVLDNPQGKFVYTPGKNEQGMDIAQPRPVEVGDWVRLEGDLENAWIIQSGLASGDQVIVEGTARIFFPGMPLQVGAPQGEGGDNASTADQPPAAK